jgi:hypothetical protein
MASQSLPIAAQAHKQNLTRASVHAPSLRAALIALVAIIIVFRWLNLIVSLQVAATANQILVSSDELAKIERANAALECSIAEASSPRNLAARAQRIGYGPRTPAYVSSDEPLLPASDGAAALAFPAEQLLPGRVTPNAVPAGSNLSSQQRAQLAP